MVGDSVTKVALESARIKVLVPAWLQTLGVCLRPGGRATSDPNPFGVRVHGCLGNEPTTSDPECQAEAPASVG